MLHALLSLANTRLNKQRSGNMAQEPKNHLLNLTNTVAWKEDTLLFLKVLEFLGVASSNVQFFQLSNTPSSFYLIYLRCQLLGIPSARLLFIRVSPPFELGLKMVGKELRIAATAVALSLICKNLDWELVAVIVACRLVTDMNSNGISWLFYNIFYRSLVINQQIMKAVFDNNPSALLEILKHPAARHALNVPNCECQFGRYALMEACFEGNVEIVQLLLKYGALVNVKDNYGTTALMFGANGNSSCLKILLDAGADVHARDVFGETALMFASLDGTVECLQLLAAYGARLNSKDSKQRAAVAFACYKGNAFAVEWLLQNGADPNCRDMLGRTPLIICAELNALSCAEILLRYNAHADMREMKYGASALTYACLYGHNALTELLITHRADVRVQDNYGRTPLMVASAKGRAECVRCLLKALTNAESAASLYVDTTDNFGNTALTFCSLQGHRMCASMLIAAQADANHAGSHGLTALMLATTAGHVETMEVLLSTGQVDLRATDSSERNVLHIACAEGHVVALSLLLEHMAESLESMAFHSLIEAGDRAHGSTPLLLACVGSSPGCVEALLVHGAMPDTTDNLGRSPLLMASHGGDVTSVQLLLEYGAGVNRSDNEHGFTALMLACCAGHIDTVRILLDYGADPAAVDADGRSAVYYCDLKSQACAEVKKTLAIALKGGCKELGLCCGMAQHSLGLLK